MVGGKSISSRSIARFPWRMCTSCAIRSWSEWFLQLLKKTWTILGRAVNRIQELGFKKVEVGLQPPLVQELMAKMREAGAACAGLSSFGPTVYAIADSGARDIEAAAREVMGDIGGRSTDNQVQE